MKRIIHLVATVLLLLLLNNSALSQGLIGPTLQSVLQSTDGLVQVIVTFDGDEAPGNAEIELLESLGISTGVTLQSLPMAAVLATSNQIEALANQPGVRSVYLNERLEYYNDNGTAITGVNKVRTEGQFQVRNGGMPLTGKGVGVVINDSGIDATHADHRFGDHVVQNVMASLNLNAVSGLLPVTILENQLNTDTNSGHGTHVAGTVGGTGAQSNGLYEGVAPGADLIGYGSGAALLVLDGIGGIDYSITNQARYGIRVINNSWGGSGDFDPEHPINLATKRAFDRNIAVVFAAGNSGPGTDTHNPYAQAPWVISVGAGTHDGELADFSSRGSNKTLIFELDGETFTMIDEPTVVAPGVDIISTRALSPVGVLSIDQDLLNLDPGHLPFYTHMMGTSMAAPHVAGIIALMLEANPALNVSEIKEILRKSATNMQGHEAFEVGAGYVNAYAAVQMAYDMATPFGATVNTTREFNSTIDFNAKTEEFSIDYGLLGLTSTDYQFEVQPGTNVIEARIRALGLLGAGNLLNLVLEDPDGKIASSGIPVLFALEIDRVVRVASPTPGTWTVRVEGLRGDEINPLGGIALPESVDGSVTKFISAGTTGLNDIEGHEAEDAIIFAVGQRLVDGLPEGIFAPEDNLTRIDLADYLVMGQEIRQNLPLNGPQFGDVQGELQTLAAHSVSARGAALSDRFHTDDGVMIPASSNSFEPSGTVSKAELAYSLVQSLGLQEQARELNNESVTVEYKGERINIDDQNQIPSNLRGYVQLALDLKILNAEFKLTQRRFALSPTLTAYFNPSQVMTRADFAVAVTRAQDVEIASGSSGLLPLATDGGETFNNPDIPATFALEQNYPNPFNPTTVISYSLPEQSEVTINVYNVMGQRVSTLVNEVQSAGQYQVNFDATNLASGVYIYQLRAGANVFTKTMNLIK
ncbi:MAG: S8 family serine peptidase [Balneolaceae bacterium]|nr:S8 family serine peptidase [Balneolaceae bacterium]